MTRKQKWIASATAIIMTLLCTTAIFATATQGGGTRHSQNAWDCYTTSVYFSSTDANKVITLDNAHFGPPDRILSQQAFDNATAGRAKTAMQNGEVINFAPNEFEGASLSAGQLTVYRTDLDGNDTLTSDVWFEITFGSKNGLF